jgi:imidazolonepropionase-like amidohydrolase
MDNGMTPMQAILAGTRDAARLCQVDEVTGTLEAGKQADVVVARGNPLENLHRLGDPANVLLVLKGGKVAKDRAGWTAVQR